MLVDHPDARMDRGMRILEDVLRAVDEDLAGVGLVQARQDVHEGGLARAVLAEQAQDLTSVDRDRDPVVGEDAGELFGDVAQFEPHAVGPRRQWLRPRSAARTGGGVGLLDGWAYWQPLPRNEQTVTLPSMIACLRVSSSALVSAEIWLSKSWNGDRSTPLFASVPE